jgi:hypothetical protein
MRCAVDWNAFADEARAAPVLSPPHASASASKPKHSAHAKKELTVSTAKPAAASHPSASAFGSAPSSAAVSHHTPHNTPLPAAAVSSPRSARMPSTAFGVSVGVGVMSAPPPSHLNHNGSGSGSGDLLSASELVRQQSAPVRHSTASHSAGGSGGSTPKHSVRAAGGGAGPSGVMDFGNILNKPVAEPSHAATKPALTMAEQIAQKKEEARMAQALAGFGHISSGGGGGAGHISAPPSNENLIHTSSTQSHMPLFTVTSAASAAAPAAITSSSSSSSAFSASTSVGAGRASVSRAPVSADAAFAFINVEKNTLLTGSNKS